MEQYIWVDALDFEEPGGWQEDTQYVHLMGSGYLIAAHEPGVPVEDAITKVKIPKEGTYRVWVRSRNWLRPHDPGLFNLIVNGLELITTALHASRSFLTWPHLVVGISGFLFLLTTYTIVFCFIYILLYGINRYIIHSR